MLEQYVKKILTSRVYDVAVETPLQTARQLSERLGNDIWLKREDLQPVFSFKIRGAYNKLTQLSDEERARGVVTASAGNHAQGLALAAKVLGVKATIVMPKTTPEIKVEGVRSRGGKVVLHGDSFPEALAYSLKLVDEKGYVYIHPYDDPHTIAGQGTVAMEILRQHPGRLDAIFVPVGGGGLIAVFGSAGERDVEKRPQMGRIAGERCRLVVVTDEDPRGEDRERILDEIAQGAERIGRRRGHDLLLIADRRAAIEAAFEAARPNDVVVLAGKGHERSIIGPDGPLPWSEEAVARDVLAAMGHVAPH